MKRSLLALLLAVMLLFSAAIPAALAEEEPSGSRLDALMEQIRSALGEEVTSGRQAVELILKKLLTTLQEKAEERGVDVEQLLDEMLDSLKNEEGKIDWSALIGKIAPELGITNEEGKIDWSALIGMIGFGFGSGNDSDSEGAEDDEEGYTYIEALQARNAAVEEYIKEEYRDMSEPGDLQVVYQQILMNPEEDPSYNLGYFELQNYTPDGKDLKFRNSAGNVEYLVFSIDENLNYELTEAIRAEEGEGYADSVAALCEKYGITVEEFEDIYTQKDYYESMCVLTFFQNHPEYERIEYRGEFRTLDEMEAVWKDAFNAMFFK